MGRQVKVGWLYFTISLNMMTGLVGPEPIIKYSLRMRKVEQSPHSLVDHSRLIEQTARRRRCNGTAQSTLIVELVPLQDFVVASSLVVHVKNMYLLTLFLTVFLTIIFTFNKQTKMKLSHSLYQQLHVM